MMGKKDYSERSQVQIASLDGKRQIRTCSEIFGVLL